MRRKARIKIMMEQFIPKGFLRNSFCSTLACFAGILIGVERRERSLDSMRHKRKKKIDELFDLVRI